MKMAHSDIIQNLLVTTHKMKVTGGNQEIETKIRNYILIEIQTFFKDFMQQEGKKESNWLLQVFCLFVWSRL